MRRGSEAADIESAHDKRVVGVLVLERIALDRNGSSVSIDAHLIGVGLHFRAMCILSERVFVFDRCAFDRSGSLLAGPLEARRVTARKRAG